MKVYKCCFTDKDCFSDAYKVELKDDLYYEITGKIVKEDVGIDESKIGGNKSAEADCEDEGTEDYVKVCSNLVTSAKLEEIPTIVTKTEFKNAIKTYGQKLYKKIKETDPERAEFLKTKMGDLVKEVLANFKKCQFYATEDDAFDCEGAVIPHISEGETEGCVCRILVFKDGLTIEKY